MRLSIVTPSFRSSAWLKLCIASVADQGAELEHIVQDSCSDDGTVDWLSSDRRVKAYIEKDSGMYDAVNRGLRKSSGEIVAYLNCDEQYLPGALPAVLEYFDGHPDVDLLFADALVVDSKGDCICYRKVLLPVKHHVMVSHLTTFTSSMFFRRKLLDRGLYFDTKWRALGDADWVLRAMETKTPMGVLRRFVSAFTDTESNLSLGAVGLSEKKQMFDSAPKWAQALAPLLVAQHRIRRSLGGMYRQAPFDYALYTQGNPNQRTAFRVERPTFVWKSRLMWTS